MSKRIRFTVIFSAPAFPYKAVLDWLGPKLGEAFSGACCEAIDGFWSADGEEDKAQFLPGQYEAGMRVLVSVTPERREAALFELQTLLQAMKDALDLPLQWIHVEEEEVIARHFRLA